MKLSEEEKKIILDKRKEKEDSLPKKIGFLKEDIFSIKDGSSDFEYPNWILSRSEKEECIAKFISEFELAVPAGSQFNCYVDSAQEQWYDSVNYGIEGMPAIWAKKYLINIKDVKK